MSNKLKLRPYSKAYSSRPSLIAQSLANRSADDYIIYDVGRGRVEQKVELVKKKIIVAIEESACMHVNSYLM